MLIADLEALYKKATPGPLEVGTYMIPPSELGRTRLGDLWKGIETHTIQTAYIHPQLKAKMQLIVIAVGPYTEPANNIRISKDDAELWVALHNALPAILTALRAAEAYLDMTPEGWETRVLRSALAALGEGPRE